MFPSVPWQLSQQLLCAGSWARCRGPAMTSQALGLVPEVFLMADDSPDAGVQFCPRPAPALNDLAWIPSWCLLMRIKCSPLKQRTWLLREVPAPNLGLEPERAGRKFFAVVRNSRKGLCAQDPEMSTAGTVPGIPNMQQFTCPRHQQGDPCSGSSDGAHHQPSWRTGHLG